MSQEKPKPGSIPDDVTLEVLGNGKSYHQKEPSVIRRAIVRALRLGRKSDSDDGDTLGESSKFQDSPFKDEN